MKKFSVLTAVCVGAGIFWSGLNFSSPSEVSAAEATLTEQVAEVETISSEIDGEKISLYGSPPRHHYGPPGPHHPPPPPPPPPSPRRHYEPPHHGPHHPPPPPPRRPRW